MKFACPQDFSLVRVWFDLAPRFHVRQATDRPVFGVLMLPGLGSTEAVISRVVDEFRVPGPFFQGRFVAVKTVVIKIPMMDR